jgi:hypothetical protein
MFQAVFHERIRMPDHERIEAGFSGIEALRLIK